MFLLERSFAATTASQKPSHQRPSCKHLYRTLFPTASAASATVTGYTDVGLLRYPTEAQTSSPPSRTPKAESPTNPKASVFAAADTAITFGTRMLPCLFTDWSHCSGRPSFLVGQDDTKRKDNVEAHDYAENERANGRAARWILFARTGVMRLAWLYGTRAIFQWMRRSGGDSSSSNARSLRAKCGGQSNGSGGGSGGERVTGIGKRRPVGSEDDDFERVQDGNLTVCLCSAHTALAG